MDIRMEHAETYTDSFIKPMKLFLMCAIHIRSNLTFYKLSTTPEHERFLGFRRLKYLPTGPMISETFVENKCPPLSMLMVVLYALTWPWIQVSARTIS